MLLACVQYRSLSLLRNLASSASYIDVGYPQLLHGLRLPDSVCIYLAPKIAKTSQAPQSCDFSDVGHDSNLLKALHLAEGSICPGLVYAR